MSLDFCIKIDELKKAMEDISEAEANGFDHCLCVFKIVKAGTMLDDNLANYSDLIEKAHETNGNLNWGRHQDVTKNNKFEDGNLIPLKLDIPKNMQVQILPCPKVK